MTDDKYQGWTNWDTWNANLWLTNEPAPYEAAKDTNTVDELRILWIGMFHKDNMPRKLIADGRKTYIDGIDPAKVNWQEIYDWVHEGRARFVNLSNPASLGVEVISEGSTRPQYQLAVIRGTGTVLFGMREPRGGWGTPTPVVDPERFGAVPTTYDELLKWAQKFHDSTG